jgi:uncharacterized protein
MPTLEDARAWYPGFDPVHGYDHVVRVYHMAEKLAEEEGADLAIVRAAALLHDAAGSTPGGEKRSEHHEYSAEFAAEVLKKEGWSSERIAAVQECIRGHRYRNNGAPPATIEARVLFDADKLDVLGAIGAARTIAYAVLAKTPHFEEPSQQFLESGSEAAGELHSAYHEYLFKLSKVKDRLFTPAAKRIAEKRHQTMQIFFDELAAEMRGEH